MGSRHVIPMKLFKSTVIQMPVAKKPVTGSFSGKNEQALYAGCVRCPLRSPASEASASNSNCTQQLLCLINFLARNTGVSTHPKNDLLCLCPGFLKTPLPIQGLDVPLLYRTNGI